MQEDIQITLEEFLSGLIKVANWKAAGPDLVHRLWFKKMAHLHLRLQKVLQEGVHSGKVPDCMS